MFLRYILCAAAAYLLGSISTGVLLSRRLFHDDVRKHGSGGTGATNMLRTYRLKAALLTRIWQACSQGGSDVQHKPAPTNIRRCFQSRSFHGLCQQCVQLYPLSHT